MTQQRAATGQGQPNRVALYLRVSTEEQAREGYSLDAQRAFGTQMAAARGWVVVKEYLDDGYTARNIKRPAYRRMMAEIEEWDMMLVHKLDRSHRNLRNFMDMMETLGNAGKGFCSVTDMFDTTTPHGRFFMDMMQRIAQLESEVIGDRVRIGMGQKLRTEQCWLGTAPYGYVKANGNLEPHPENGKWVKWMFEQRANGVGLAAISRALTDLKAPSQKGGKWNLRFVRAALSNPVYVGLRRIQGKAVPNHPPIVELELFRHVQEQLATKAWSVKYGLPETTTLEALSGNGANAEGA